MRKRTLTNNNAQPVMFKVKTTAQKVCKDDDKRIQVLTMI